MSHQLQAVSDYVGDWLHRQDHWIFFTVVGLDDNLNIFFLGKNPDLGTGFYAGQECGTLGIGATLGKPSNEVGRASTHWANLYWASHQTRLGEPVLRGRWASLIGRTRVGRAIKRGWGEPSNEVGRASTKGPLGEPTFTAASTPASKLRLLGAVPTVCSARQVPARHCACSARLVPARHV